MANSTLLLNDDARAIEEVQPLRDVPRPTLQNINLWCKGNCFSEKILKRRLPILTWLPKYSLADLKGDVVAGLTVALTVIPQGLALALLANLPPQYGLYTAFMGCFVYTIFGSCKDLTIGPTSIMSLMTAHYATSGGITYSVLLTFLAGCLMLVMGILNLGFLVTFISSSVVSGFTMAAVITISATQLGGLLGVSFKSEGFIQDLTHFFQGLSQGRINYWDMTMGLSCIVFLLLINHFRKLKFDLCCPTRLSKFCESVWFTLATARNAVLVLACAGVAAALEARGIRVLSLTKEVQPGLPPFRLPAFSYSRFDNASNATVDKDFAHMAGEMGSGILIISLLCILESIAIAKSFSKGRKIDATQEMIALGLCNIMGSFVSSYPATGSFSRTAINYNSGVRTQAGCVVTGAMVLLALGFMSPYFKYIPKASLSALIISAVLNMAHYQDVPAMWRTNKLDLVPFFATIVVSFVLGLEYGILTGIGISLCFLLLQVAKPNISSEEEKTPLDHSYLFVKPDRSILFPSAEYLQSKIAKSTPDIGECNDVYAILLDCDHIMSADYTMATSCRNMIDHLKEENVFVVFLNLRENVRKAIEGAFVTEIVFFSSKDEGESYIDALYSENKQPPAYLAESNEKSIGNSDQSHIDM